MPAITFDRFDGGLDVRQLATSADANRLRVLDNAYVTTGRSIRKRAGLKKIGNLSDGTVGLFAGKGTLYTFSSRKVEHTGGCSFINNAQLSDASGLGISHFLHGEVFNQNLYLAVRHGNGQTKHHYLDGTSNTEVVDKNCPHGEVFTKKAGKLFCIDKDVVRFCKTNDARVWTEGEDAGFLPVALQQTGANLPTALGEYQNYLVVFFNDSTQLWRIDPDPRNHALFTTAPIGAPYPYAHANMSGDIFFLSPSGFRSVGLQSMGLSLTDNDIGSPIDIILREEMKQEIRPKTIYYRGGGQLMCFIGNHAYVYSFSMTGKISAWSRWNFPFKIEDVAELAGRLYVRADNAVYVFDDEAFDDAGVPFEVVIELPYLDCRKPGVLKQFTGIDVSAVGSMDLQFKINAAREDFITIPLKISNDTRPLPRLPVEIMATNLAIRLSNNTAEFELAGITLYYENLSTYNT